MTWIKYGSQNKEYRAILEIETLLSSLAVPAKEQTGTTNLSLLNFLLKQHIMFSNQRPSLNIASKQRPSLAIVDNQQDNCRIQPVVNLCNMIPVSSYHTSKVSPMPNKIKKSQKIKRVTFADEKENTEVRAAEAL